MEENITVNNGNKNHYKERNFLIVVVFVLVIVITVSFVLFYMQATKTNNSLSGTNPTPTPEQGNPDMMLSFMPNTVSVNPGGNFSSEIKFDSYGNPVNQIIISLSYDPAQITNVKFTPVKDPKSSLSNAFNLIAGIYFANPAGGTISETITVPKTIIAPRGSGIIAKITGTLSKTAKGTTIIRLLKDSAAFSPAIKNVVLGKINLEIDVK